jgi:hypothetical protein
MQVRVLPSTPTGNQPPTTRRSSSGSEHRPPKAEVARSNRAGETTHPLWLNGKSTVVKWRGRTFESCRRGQVVIVQWPRRRALNPETGVRLPVTAPMPDRPSGRTPDCYSEDGGSNPPLAAPPPGGRAVRHAAADRVTQVRFLSGCPCRSDATERGSFSPKSNTPRHGSAAGSRRGTTRHTHLPRSNRFPDRAHVVVVQRRGSRDATPNMRVRIPPTTPLPAPPATRPMRRPRVPSP